MPHAIARAAARALIAGAPGGLHALEPTFPGRPVEIAGPAGLELALFLPSGRISPVAKSKPL